MKDGEICYGLVGLGMGGQTHARELSRLPGARLSRGLRPGRRQGQDLCEEVRSSEDLLPVRVASRGPRDRRGQRRHAQRPAPGIRDEGGGCGQTRPRRETPGDLPRESARDRRSLRAEPGHPRRHLSDALRQVRDPAEAGDRRGKTGKAARRRCHRQGVPPARVLRARLLAWYPRAGGRGVPDHSEHPRHRPAAVAGGPRGVGVRKEENRPSRHRDGRLRAFDRYFCQAVRWE